MLAIFAVLLSAEVVALRPRVDRITLDNSDRIHVGMMRAEVEAMLGPPGDYTTGPTDPNRYFTVWTGNDYATGELNPDRVRFTWTGSLPEAGSVATVWESDTATIDIVFDGQGKVTWMQSAESRLQQLGPLNNLLWRLKRQWHRWFPE
jgi:hypothetical protein